MGLEANLAQCRCNSFAESLCTSVLYAAVDSRRSVIMDVFLNGGVIHKKVAQWYDEHMMAKMVTQNLKNGTTAANFVKLYC